MTEKSKDMPSYIVVSDRNDKVLLKANSSWAKSVIFANKVRAAGGECSIWRKTKG